MLKSNSTTIKGFFAILFMAASFIYMMKYASNEQAKIISLVLISLFIFNFAVRSMPAFKSYFLSPINFLSGKATIIKEIDFPKDLLVEKFQEVLINEGFSIKSIDKEAGSIFATTKLSWKTWGENIYVEIADDGTVCFTSVAVVGVFTWGKNEANLKKLVIAFEESLTI